MKRRDFLKILLGGAATVVAPVTIAKTVNEIITQPKVDAKIEPKEFDQNIVMPLIRRTMPRLLAENIVGVQPMGSPTGEIFDLRNLYDLPPGAGKSKRIKAKIEELKHYVGNVESIDKDLYSRAFTTLPELNVSTRIYGREQ